jgi:hypothetical protein
MADYMLLMHDDATDGVSFEAWERYFDGLRALGRFEGGSAIGGGACVRKAGAPGAFTASLGGFIRISADSLEHAKALLAGNPVFEAGGTIEIRELPRTS